MILNGADCDARPFAILTSGSSIPTFHNRKLSCDALQTNPLFSLTKTLEGRIQAYQTRCCLSGKAVTQTTFPLLAGFRRVLYGLGCPCPDPGPYLRISQTSTVPFRRPAKIWAPSADQQAYTGDHSNSQQNSVSLPVWERTYRLAPRRCLIRYLQSPHSSARSPPIPNSNLPINPSSHEDIGGQISICHWVHDRCTLHDRRRLVSHSQERRQRARHL